MQSDDGPAREDSAGPEERFAALEDELQALSADSDVHAPERAQRLSAFERQLLSFTTEQIGQMAALVDVDKMDHKDAAKKWLADNEKVWTPWTKAGM